MRACRCVSERRSRPSAEVRGQYQSQTRDNHSPAMRLADACVPCVRTRVRKPRAGAEHARASQLQNELFLALLGIVGSIPSDFAISRDGDREREREREGGREGERGKDRCNQVCIRFAEGADFCKENKSTKDTFWL